MIGIFKKINKKYFFVLLFVLGIFQESISSEDLFQDLLSSGDLFQDILSDEPFSHDPLFHKTPEVKEAPSFSDKVDPDENTNPNIDREKSPESKNRKRKAIPLSPSHLPIEKNNPVWPEGITPLKIATMGLLQRSLFREGIVGTPPQKKSCGNNRLGGEEEVDLTKVTPEKLDDFKKLGGLTPELRKQYMALRRARPRIRNPLFLASTPEIFSPVALRVLSRQEMQSARQTGTVISLPLIAHEEPPIEESEEERRIRQEMQERDFLEAEKRRGKVPEDLKAEMRREFEIWQDHLNYIKMRKTQLFGEEETVADDTDEGEDDIEINEAVQEKEGKVKKIRKGEIEDTFFRFVAPHLEHLEVDGYDVYFTKETLDLDRVDIDGVKNWKNMQTGNCPIGPDKEPMNFHHLTHYDYATHKIKSIIVLITYTLHTVYSGRLHFGRTTYRDLPRKKVIRHLFTPERKSFNRSIVYHLRPEK